MQHKIESLPTTMQVVVLCLALLATFAVSNLIYHVLHKPTEVFSPASSNFNKTPVETWRQYAPLFRQYSTASISPELLAALAQVESAGNPVASTYWRWRLTRDLFALYQPASSALDSGQQQQRFAHVLGAPEQLLFVPRTQSAQQNPADKACDKPAAAPARLRTGGRQRDVTFICSKSHRGFRSESGPNENTGLVDYDIVRFDIRSDDRQVWTERSEWIGLHQRMVGGASSALIARLRRTSQPGALRKHRVNPGSISVGCAVTDGGHSRILSVHAVNRMDGQPRTHKARIPGCVRTSQRLGASGWEPGCTGRRDGQRALGTRA